MDSLKGDFKSGCYTKGSSQLLPKTLYFERILISLVTCFVISFRFEAGRVYRQPGSRVAVVLAQLLPALKKEFNKEMKSVEANKVSITTKGTR